jgi:hypothetical protein
VRQVKYVPDTAEARAAHPAAVLVMDDPPQRLVHAFARKGWVRLSHLPIREQGKWRENYRKAVRESRRSEG